MNNSRVDCPMRHENGNCTVAGGSCASVNDPICEALHDAYDCGYRRAVHGQNELKWIPVTERLPDRTMPPRDVLVYHDLGCGMFVDRAWYSYEKNRWSSVLGMKLKVTHWMPIPESPKGEN